MKITINNIKYEFKPSDNQLLIDYLRNDLNLTGTKRGCDDRACGACTVIINGIAKRSCKTKLKDLNNAKIITIEGLSTCHSEHSEESLHPIQKAFLDVGAVQCGFCTPGMVLTTYALLKKNPKPTRNQIKKALAGNLCRCTGYKQIIDAVLKVSKSH